MAEELVNKLIESYDEKSGNFGILVNGMGSTPLMEQYVFANDVNSLLKENGIKVIYKKSEIL